MPQQRILVVDDEPDAATYLRAVLEDEGYEVGCAYDGELALAALRREPFDLVLLDVQMPGPTGVHLHRKIQGDERLRHIPVILVTGVSGFSVFDEECRAVSAPAVVEKPIDPQVLLAAVRDALSREKIPG